MGEKELEELESKQAILNNTKDQLSRIEKKIKNGEKLEFYEIKYLTASLGATISIIQDDLLTPAFAKYENNGPIH